MVAFIMMDPLKKATVIEGVATTMDRDVQGETLDLDGADISALESGSGYANSDHSGRFEHLVGRITKAKKIKALADCETPSQIKYYSDLKKPFLWAEMELWDGHGHKEADAIGSIYKYYQSKGEEPPIKLSVEGKTLERGKGGLLKRTVIKGIALTVHPANKSTRTEVVRMLKSAGANEDMCKSEDFVPPVFIERHSYSAMERILELSTAVRDLIKSAATSEKGMPRLKSVALLERLLALKARR